MGALVAKCAVTQQQVQHLVTSAVATASMAAVVGSNAQQQLADEMHSAIRRQTEASSQSEEQARQVQGRRIEQLAELHRPQVPSCSAIYCLLLYAQSCLVRDLVSLFIDCC